MRKIPNRSTDGDRKLPMHSPETLFERAIRDFWRCGEIFPRYRGKSGHERTSPVLRLIKFCSELLDTTSTVIKSTWPPPAFLIAPVDCATLRRDPVAERSQACSMVSRYRR